MDKNFEFESRDPPRRKPARRSMLPAIIVAGVVFAGVVCFVCYLAFRNTGNTGNTSSSERGSDSPPEGKTIDYAEFETVIKRNIPIDRPGFVKAGCKAESYRMDTFQRDEFLEVVLKIEPPVWLRDKVTGKTERYTKARLIRSSQQFAARNFWQTVEMIK